MTLTGRASAVVLLLLLAGSAMVWQEFLSGTSGAPGSPGRRPADIADPPLAVIDSARSGERAVARRTPVHESGLLLSLGFDAPVPVDDVGLVQIREPASAWSKLFSISDSDAIVLGIPSTGEFDRHFVVGLEGFCDVGLHVRFDEAGRGVADRIPLVPETASTFSVRDLAGTAIPELRLRLSEWQGFGSDSDHEIPEGEDFEVVVRDGLATADGPIAVGVWRVSALPEDLEVRPNLVRLDADHTAPIAMIVHAGLRIRGRVVERTGTGLSGVFVQASLDSDSDAGTGVYTKEDGSFSLSRNPESPLESVTLRAYHPEFEISSRSAQWGEGGVVLFAERRPVVRLRVIGERGIPLERGYVQFEGERDGRWSPVAGAGGVWVLPRAHDAPVRLRVLARDRRHGVSEWYDVAPGYDRQGATDVEVPVAQSVEVVWVDSAGAGVEGAGVSLVACENGRSPPLGVVLPRRFGPSMEPDEGSANAFIVDSHRTGSDGRAHLRSLVEDPRLTFWIRAQGSDDRVRQFLWRGERVVRVEDSGSIGLTLQWKEMPEWLPERTRLRIKGDAGWEALLDWQAPKAVWTTSAILNTDVSVQVYLDVQRRWITLDSIPGGTTSWQMVAAEAPALLELRVEPSAAPVELVRVGGLERPRRFARGGRFRLLLRAGEYEVSNAAETRRLIVGSGERVSIEVQ